MHPQKLLSGLLMLASVSVAEPLKASSAPQAPTLDAQSSYQRALYRALTASMNPRDWVMASQIVFDRSPAQDIAEQQTALLRRAAAAAPEDRLIGWLNAVQTEPASERGGAARPRAFYVMALVQLEPDNAGAWLQLAAVADAAADEPRVIGALANAAAAAQVDTHSLDLLEAWLATYGRSDLPPLPVVAESAPESLGLDAEAQRGVTALAASGAASGVAPLVRLCDGRKLMPEAWQRRAVCADAARKILFDGRTVLDVALGAAVLRRLDLATPRDQARIASIDWLRAQLEILHRQPIASEQIRMLLTEWRRSGSEIAAQRLVLEQAGIASTPPLGWARSVETD